MNRATYRSYCALVLLGVTLFAAGHFPIYASDIASGNEKKCRPNYVVILADDLGTVGLGCYGSPNANASPNIDRIAKEGVLFRNMFTTSATCAPTRAELYTGLHPERNGCNRNHCATKSETKSIVHYLTDLGYRVGLTGKKHIRPGTVYPFQYIEGIAGGCGQKDPPPDDWTPIKKFMTENAEQPFCLFIGSIHPHTPWTLGNPELWKKEDLVLPESFIDTETARKFFQAYLAEVRTFDDQVGVTDQLMHSLRLEGNTVFVILGENGIGMPGGKYTNYHLGVRSACIIRWPHITAKGTETDAIAHYCDIVPTLIDGAGGRVPDNLDGKSLLPVLEAKKTSVRDRAYFVHLPRIGRIEDPHISLRGITDGRYKLLMNLTPQYINATQAVNGIDFGKRTYAGNAAIYYSWLEAVKANPSLTPFVERIRYSPEVQLFDLTKDPWELDDLAGHPEYQPKVQALKAELKTWMNSQGDHGYLEGDGIKYSDTPF